MNVSNLIINFLRSEGFQAESTHIIPLFKKIEVMPQCDNHVKIYVQEFGEKSHLILICYNCMENNLKRLKITIDLRDPDSLDKLVELLNKTRFTKDL